MVWGKVSVDDDNKTIMISDEKGSTITDFFASVQSSARQNLLTKYYYELQNKEKPRYFIVRYYQNLKMENGGRLKKVHLQTI